MKPLEAVLAAAVLALGCFVGLEMVSMSDTANGTIVATASNDGTVTKRLKRVAASGTVNAADRDNPAYGRLAPAELRRRVQQGGDGTYIGELLTARDSALTRWPDRTTRPLRVWVQRAIQENWSDEYISAVQSAFDTWSDVGIPVHFTFVADSTSADVRVRFRNRFDSGISGKTVWSRDARWWLLNGDIELALSHPSGGRIDIAQMRAIALHEVGHLLGLDHTESSDHIMAPRVRVRDLSDGDRATVRLLYSVPAGSLR